MKKKLFTLLAATQLMGMVALSTNPVHAVDNGSITVQGTQKGEEYQVVKLFGATVNNNGGVSYTITGNEDFLSDGEFLRLFTVVDNGGDKYVVRNEGIADSEIIAWAQLQTLPAVTMFTENGTDATETVNVDYGYYLVKSSLNNGAVVMVSSVSPTAIIQEKNSRPGWDDKDDKGSKTSDKATYNVGDIITYTLDYKTAVNYADGQKVYQYVVEDIGMDANALDYMENTLRIKVIESDGEEHDLVQFQDFELEESANGFKATIKWAETQTPTEASKKGGAEDFLYKGKSRIVVTYNAKVKEGLTEGSAKVDSNKNTATINFNKNQDDNGKTTYVYEGKITINKVDGKDQSPLNGAEFVLRNSAGKYLKVEDGKRSFVDSINEATKLVTVDGAVNVTGIEEGDYDLVETKAPQGYNLLKDPVRIELRLNKDYNGGVDTLAQTTTVANNKGDGLPSTGSVGTTAFQIVGAVMVGGAILFFVADRRSRLEDKDAE